MPDTSTVYYQAISEHYEGKFAKRTGLPYIKHIDDGLRVLDAIEASDNAKAAYCLHPIVQGDEDLAVFMDRLESGDELYVQFGPQVLVLAVEYRNCANRYLSMHHGKDTRVPRLSPLADVNDMLIADKVQNYHDFMARHHGTHPNSDTLYDYFHAWFDVLGVDDLDPLLAVCEPAD